MSLPATRANTLNTRTQRARAARLRNILLLSELPPGLVTVRTPLASSHRAQGVWHARGHGISLLSYLVTSLSFCQLLTDSNTNLRTSRGQSSRRPGLVSPRPSVW